MHSLLAELGQKEIITVNTAVRLRNYISLKNPGLSPYRRAYIFSDAVNRIVDARVPKLADEKRKRLKELLFKEAACKPAFTIDCSDVFKSVLNLKTSDYLFFMELTRWLGDTIGKKVIKESVFDFVVHAHKLMDEFPNSNVSDIVGVIERRTGGLKFTETTHTTADYPDIREYRRITGPEMQTRTPAFSAQIPKPKRVMLTSLLRKLVTNRESLDVSGTRNNPGRAVLVSGLAGMLLSSFFMMNGFSNSMITSADNDWKYSGTYNAYSTYALIPDVLRNRAVLENTTAVEGISLYTASRMRMKATAYDLSVQSCGKERGDPEYGITSSGVRALAGRTIAVDPEVIPLGSRVYISFPEKYKDMDGIYYAEDTGRLVKGKAIDIFFGEDQIGSSRIFDSAMEFGVQYVDISIIGS